MGAAELPRIRETRIGAYGICVVEGRILVIRKAKGPYKGTFDLPGGGVEYGEHPAEAVVREFLEETGTQVVAESIVGVYSRRVDFVSDDATRIIQGHHMGFLYRVTQSSPGAALKEDADGLDSLGAVWLPLEEAVPEAISPLVAEALRCIAR